MLGKKRGRKPSKKTVKARSKEKTRSHWLDCSTEDCLEGAMCDGDVVVYTCGLCVCKDVPWQLPKPPKTDEEKAAARDRKVAREAKKKAIADGTFVAPEKSKKTGFGRGWHRCLIFSNTDEDGKTEYFSKGKKITKARFTKLVKQHAAKGDAKPTESFGRGWHFKKNFVAPNGDVYECGKLTKKASKSPTIAELQALMAQHVKEEA